MRDLNLPIDCPDLIDSFDLRTKASMHAENLAVDDSSNGKVVEYFSAVLPRIGVTVFPINLIVKSINSRNLSK